MKLMSESLANIAPAIVQAQSKMGNASKDAKNPFFKSKYADLNAVREAVLPPFNENGISVLQPTVMLDGRKFVQTMLLHSSGEFFSSLTEILSVKEGDAQAQGSGISYARRYGLQSLANIGADDDDGNAASGKKEAPPIRGNTQTAVGNGNVQTVSTSAVKEASGDLKIVSVTTTPIQEAPKSGSKSFRTPKPATKEDL